MWVNVNTKITFKVWQTIVFNVMSILNIFAIYDIERLFRDMRTRAHPCSIQSSQLLTITVLTNIQKVGKECLYLRVTDSSRLHTHIKLVI